MRSRAAGAASTESTIRMSTIQRALRMPIWLPTKPMRGGPTRNATYPMVATALTRAAALAGSSQPAGRRTPGGSQCDHTTDPVDEGAADNAAECHRDREDAEQQGALPVVDP